MWMRARDPTYVAAPIEFPVAIIHLYTGRLAAQGVKRRMLLAARLISAQNRTLRQLRECTRKSEINEWLCDGFACEKEKKEDFCLAILGREKKHLSRFD